MIDFLVVDCPSAYNAILRRSAMNQLKTVTSIYNLLMRFPSEGGIGEVRGDQVAARECYMASLKGEPAPKESMSIDSLEVRDERTRVVVEPGGEMEDIILNPNTLDGVTRVGLNLLGEFKVWLQDFLINN